MASGSRIPGDASLDHVERRDLLDPTPTRDEPMIGAHDPVADAKATEKYFRTPTKAELMKDAEDFIRGVAAEAGFITKDSGQRQEFITGSVRDTRDGKGRYDLIPPYALSRLAQVYERGATKYGERNWEKGQPLSRFLDSALRHTFQVLEGKTDEDHAGQAAWNLLAYIEIQHRIATGNLPAELGDL